MGLTMPSVYNAFGNKESLFMKAGPLQRKPVRGGFREDAACEVVRGILMGEAELVSGKGTL
jgi:hypothetical protein